ncbi:MAG: biopolymer transporter ExbD [Tannerella sp.]|jgi:biopolymer transport protein ExbD|nr:biopolymer transporter ExbD [Tannerella sp.]
MSGKKRKVPGINGSSSADIAFMLLLFFLLTTSMDTDQGLPRRLPRPPENKDNMDEQKVNKRNTLMVMVSSDNRIMCAGEEVTLAQLREKTKDFIENPNNSENLPEKKPVDLPIFGTQMITSEHIISLQCDRGTEYQTYINVQNELAAAYNDLRDIISKRQFGKVFRGLDDEEQRNAVMKYYPQKISEAEPKKYGDTKKK